MDFLDPEIQGYAEAHTQPESDLLHRINRETHLEVLKPRMLSGHLQGRLLSMFSHMMQPRMVVEVGTYTGYSALCLAEGLAPDGQLITIDVNEELDERVRAYVQDAGLADRISFRLGNALDILPEIEGPLDMVFIDADKVNYGRYFDLVIDKVRPGGLILADNVLWSGKVVQPVKDNDEATKALLAFNDMVQDDPRVENILLPVRDGIMMARKL